MGAGPSPVEAALCDPINPLFWQPLPGEDPQPNNCLGGTGFRCYQAESLGTFARLADANCDPTQGSGCVVQLGVRFKFPGLQAMIAEDGLGASLTPIIDWTTSGGGFVGKCGTPAFGGQISADFVDTFLQFGGVTCANSEDPLSTYSVKAVVCETGCRHVTTVTVTDGGPVFTAGIGCPASPLPGTCGESTCQTCVQGTGIEGRGAETEGGGPGATLRYAAGGAGRADSPGMSEWRTTLGRYWSHDYAERIVPDPDDSHVWLITKYGSFREFSSKDAGGFYQSVSPSDEYRTLSRTADGWELRDFEGTVQAFDEDGKWVSTTDRNGNATTASYDAFGKLETVVFPDGRSETFTYHVASKLESITEVGWMGSRR